MSWSVEQQRLLHALGHDLMVHGRVWPAPAAMPAAVREREPAARAMPVLAKSAPQVSASTLVSATAPSARLLEALRRAAGGADVAALVGDLNKLRTEPALKRALWPRLRTLRRSH